MSNFKLKPFTDQEWTIFSGTDSPNLPAPNNVPLFCETIIEDWSDDDKTVMIIVDKHGFEIIGENHSVKVGLPFLVSKLFLENLTEKLTIEFLEKIGFKIETFTF